MNLELDLQNVVESTNLPSFEKMHACVLTTLEKVNYSHKTAEITVRVVEQAESQQLNYEFRGKNSPTNVLSFPFESPPHIVCDLLGDLILCLPVVEREAAEQLKTIESHWLHLIVHGTLHLLGFDHLEEAEAEEMEALETAILACFQIKNPY